MRRKIIKQGHNTLTITLPSEWARRFNLEAGKEIELDEKDNGLFITTEKNGKHKMAEFDITGMDVPTVWKYIMGVYREGYSEIKIKFDPKMRFDSPYKFHSQHRLDLEYKKKRDMGEPIEALHNFVNRFVDFEVVEHGKDFVVVREMGELTNKEFDNSLRRIFLLIRQMAEETLEAIKTNNAKPLSHMHDIDINLDKFHDYCVRILNRVGNKDSRKTSLLFGTLYLLELLGDEFKTVSHHLLYDFGPKCSFKKIEQIAELTKKQIDNYYDLYYKFEKSKVGLFSEMDKEAYIMVPKIYKASNEDEKEVFHHLRVIGRYINALIELRIEMEF